MATVGALGGSQLDVQGLVAQLVAAERAPLDRTIARDAERVTTQISAVGQLMGGLSSFRSALSSLKTIDVFSTRQAVSSNNEVFTATTTASAVPGSYDIEVVQRAKAQQLSSNAFSGGANQVVGTGTLTLSLGAKNFSVTIGNNNQTLAGIRDAINSATDNPGIRATLVQGTGGSHLVLSSSETGAANTIGVAHSGGNGGLAAVAYSAASPSNYTQVSQAQDAILNIANVQINSASNVVNNAIDGVTLTLTGESEEGSRTTLNVGYDTAAVKSRITNFVTAYNGLMSQVQRLRSYNATTETAGPMLGDSLLMGIESQVRRSLSEAVPAGGNFQTLAAIGITTQLDGSLAIDDSKLTEALRSDFGAVGRLFGSEQGVGAKLFSQIDGLLASGGALDTRSKGLVKQQETLADRKDAIDVRMAAVQKGYLAQFTRLDTMLSQLQVTSSYLTQQIESLGNMNRSR